MNDSEAGLLHLNRRTYVFAIQDGFLFSMAKYSGISGFMLLQQVRYHPKRLTTLSNSLVAVTASGDVYQWGTDYDNDAKAPELTLRGKNIERVEMSADTVFALSKDSVVYSIPISKKEQLEGKKPKESALFGLSSTSAPISYRTLQPALGFGEK